MVIHSGRSTASWTYFDGKWLEGNPMFRNGVRTGKLFVNLADAECAVGSGTYCEWRLNELDVYYQWETGMQPHNQFAAVKDTAGQFVNFDAPLQVNYTVPQGAAYRDKPCSNFRLVTELLLLSQLLNLSSVGHYREVERRQ